MMQPAAANAPDGGFALHGGRLCVARAMYPSVPTPWIDLSTGINPRPYPAPRASAAARARLPEPTQLALLEQIAARAFGVDDAARVVAVTGSELALRLLPAVLDRTHATVVSPTYSSHLDAWRRAGVRVQEIRTPVFDTATMSGGVLVLVNPNNPDGSIATRESVLALHAALADCGGTLIVDEAFVETAPGCSVADLAGSERAPRLIVLRSFGKFYGLAGVRLGFVIAEPLRAAKLRGLIGDWPVSADALAAGVAAYADSAWAERTRSRLQSTARRLDALLEGSGFEIVGGTSLFRLARRNDAAAHFERLLHAGILARPFQHDPTLLRFGLPHGASAWQRLHFALGASS
jgi:cobalamin biosynthesis protein CobC